MKLCHKKINTNSHNNKILEEGSQCICLSYILIDSVYRGKIILKLFQKNVNMLLKKKKTSKFVIDNIEVSYDNSDRENYDEESSN